MEVVGAALAATDGGGVCFAGAGAGAGFVLAVVGACFGAGAGFGVAAGAFLTGACGAVTGAAG